ncbi:Uncharacterized conserved protein [Ceraceosorus bombacis]|uniref:rRNA biogenesis protein RRP36 n=1 Tax=Ceraceosorus bombacis TaxID=401625 RepID=A0A0N7L9D0_9BASI|nr:Uncharacterized conserved protein [Ceraceosorus bombacis]
MFSRLPPVISSAKAAKAQPPKRKNRTAQKAKASGSSSNEAEEDEEEAIRTQMRSVPFGALAKAQAKLEQSRIARGVSSSSSEQDWQDARSESSASLMEPNDEEDEWEAEREAKRAQVRLQLQAIKPAGLHHRKETQVARDTVDSDRSRAEIASRIHKHAPTEQSSRRPVSRKRQVVDVAASRSRDPRFSALSGSTHNKALFKASYGFLRDVQASEVGDLKTTLSRLNRLERNHAGPKARSERALEIREEKRRVEEALRRAEGLENERKRREREDAVLGGYKREQRERKRAGGKTYHLTDAAKRALILQDKYARLSGGKGANATPVGGRGVGDASAAPAGNADRSALRKALERRRKKNAQKERKEMPGFARDGGGGSGAASGAMSRERKREAAKIQGVHPHKRGRRG